MMNPLVGRIRWPVPENNTISVTLFKDPRTYELEDKDWSFVIEDVSICILNIHFYRMMHDDAFKYSLGNI